MTGSSILERCRCKFPQEVMKLHTFHFSPSAYAKEIKKAHGVQAALMLVCLVGTLFLAACGGQPSASGQAPVTLKIIQYANPQQAQFVKALSAKFHKKYPYITVQNTSVPDDKYDQLRQTRISTNDVDIIAVQGLTQSPQSWTHGVDKPFWQQWADAGLLTDLTVQPFLKNYYPQSLQNASTYQGKIYSVTTGSYAYSGIFYNKDIFQQYGLSAPTTWSELMQVCQTLQSHGVAPFTIGGQEQWPILLPAWGMLADYYPNLNGLLHDLWTGKVKWNDPQMVTVFQHTQKLLQYTEKGFTGINTQVAAGRFAAGKSAMLITGMWDGASIAQDNPSVKYGYIPIPGSDDAQINNHFTGKYDLGWVVPAKAPHKDAALKWLEFFSQPDNYAEWVNTIGILPSQPNVAITAPFLKEIAPQAADFKQGWDQVSISPKGAGKYAGLSVTQLAPIGPVNDPVDLAKKSEADWAAALPKS